MGSKQIMAQKGQEGRIRRGEKGTSPTRRK